MDTEIHGKSSNLVFRILIPIALTLIILLGIGIYTSQKQFDNSLSDHVSHQVNAFSESFLSQIEHQTHILESTLLLLKDHQEITKAFEQRDKKALLQLSQPLFKSILHKLHISHFYFTDLQRVNFLRVHDPDRSGDLINRLTTIAAEKNNSASTGIELGPLGTLTLRSVSPWFNAMGNKIGYIELGIDISQILRQDSEINHLGLLLLIQKNLLSQQLWEQGQEVFGGASDWNQFDDFAMSREHWLSEPLLENMPELAVIMHSAPGSGPLHKLGDATYRWQSIPVRSLGNQETGHIIIAADVSDWINNYHTKAIKTITVYVLVSVILILVLYRYIRRLQNAETDLYKSMQQLHQLASYDQLTQLPNRQMFINEVEQRLEESTRFKQQFAICFIDLDNFKMINDTMGHEQGDTLLQSLAQILRKNIREYDILSRFGGDEFVLIMPHTDAENAVTIVEKLLQDSARPFIIQNQEIYITLSIGISMFPQDGSDSDTLLRHADAAMYQAKEAGKNCFRFFTSSINQKLQRQQTIESRLRNAIKKDELQLVYQPQFDLKTGKLCACEALLRWLPEEGELISPAEFIPVAEKTALINDIGNWVFEQACQQRLAWKKSGLDIRIDINLSGRQLRYNNIYQFISHELSKHGLDFGDIGIELTENSLIEADEHLIESMTYLVEQGTQIAIDDFGTGYSSLSYLKKFPVTTVKIDQSFVRDAPEDPNDRAIMAAIVAMGHSLGLQVIVEGIESQQHEQIAREISCDLAQGFYYQKPKPADEIDIRQTI